MTSAKNQSGADEKKCFVLQMSSASPVGTMAFLLDEEALLVRVRSGWQYIAVREINFLTSEKMT